MNKNKLKELAGELDAAPRTGPEGSAEGEGARVITLTDELAKKMATDLRAAADAEGGYGMSARYAEQFGAGASNDDRDQATEFKSDTADPKNGSAPRSASTLNRSPSRRKPITCESEDPTRRRPVSYGPAGPRKLPRSTSCPSGRHSCSSITGRGVRSAITRSP